MGDKCFFFAGGGTGGHIYPAIAVAQQLIQIEPTAKIHFFCSSREIDRNILSKTGFGFTILPAKGFSARLGGLVGFCISFLSSYKIAKEVIAEKNNSVVIGVGGFVSAPVCLAARRKKIPLSLLNVDILPGKANKIIARWASQIFVQFDRTKECYGRKRKTIVSVVGCPLRSGFENPQPDRSVERLGIDTTKKILLITGASSGSQNINRAVCLLLEKLDTYANDWQIVHLAGRNNVDKVRDGYKGTEISHIVLDYYDDMPDLLAAVDLVIGRSGAVSVAEFAAAQVPALCMPYPYHKDRHQYLNAGILVEAGAAVIVDDVPDEKKRAEGLWRELEKLLKNDSKRAQMAFACKKIAYPRASLIIAEKIIKLAEGR